MKAFCPVILTEPDAFVWLLDNMVQLDAKQVLIYFSVPPMIKLEGLVLHAAAFSLSFLLTAIFSAATTFISEA